MKDIPCGLMIGTESYVRSLDTCGLIPGRRILRRRSNSISKSCSPSIRIEIMTSPLKMSWPVTLRFVNSLEYTFAQIEEIVRSFRLIRNSTTVRKELKFKTAEKSMFIKKSRDQSKMHHVFHKYDIINTAVNVNVCLLSDVQHLSLSL